MKYIEVGDGDEVLSARPHPLSQQEAGEMSGLVSVNSDSLKSSRYASLAVPGLTVFLSNGCIMAVELVAGRLISRHVGSSLYTWTAIIGLILAGMSLGNYLGGRLADRYPSRKTLAALFLLSAAGCVGILFLNDLVGGWGALRGLSWPARIFTHVALVFVLPATLLGTITPVVAKMALDLGMATGRTVGAVFACGVAGSIIGTFLTGYYLVQVLGVTQIVVAMSAALAVLGVAYFVAGRNDTATVFHHQYEDESPELPLADKWAYVGANATVFVSNAAFMIVEMAAMRMVARQFGSSLYTWTTVIGVVLAGITFGNYAGGRLADRFPFRRTLSSVFVLSSVAVVVAPLCAFYLAELLGSNARMMQLSWPMQIFSYVAGAFFLPSLVIGTITPVVVKLTLVEGRLPGRTVGAIYAWGSVGSIFGTFLAGYYLIDWIGSLPVLALVALLLAVTGASHAKRPVYSGAWAAAAALLLVATLVPAGPLGTLSRALAFQLPETEHVVFEDESNYSYVRVTHFPDQPHRRQMMLDRLIHSYVNLEDPEEMMYEYEWVYAEVLDEHYPRNEPIRAMVIGGGGFSFPRYLEVTRPGSYVEVSEIDPVVTEAAFESFGLPRDTSIEIYDMDARNRVDDIQRLRASGDPFERFDCVFGDSINDYAVPYHLTTLEFVEQIASLMKDDGVYMLNMIDAFNSGRFLAAIVQTCQAVFENVYVFNTGVHPSAQDTFVVVSSNRELNMDRVLARLVKKHRFKGVVFSEDRISGLIERADVPMLTDNFAPVENYLAAVTRANRGDVGMLHYENAIEAASAGDKEKAVELCRKALEVHPEWAVVEMFLAQLLGERGDRDEQIARLRRVVRYHPEPGVAYAALANALFDAGKTQEAKTQAERARTLLPTSVDALFLLGKIAMAEGRTADALEFWRDADRLRPNHVPTLYNLGLASAANDDLAGAVRHWRNALAHNPEHEDSLYNLAVALNMQGDNAGAQEAVQKLQALGVTVDQNLLDRINLAPNP